MSKKNVQWLTVLLAGMMAVPFAGAFAGCASSSSSNEEIDATKTQIWVDHYNGGVGNAWFAPLKARFEAAYADYKLGDKVGVQVLKSDHKNEGSQQIDGVTSSKMDIYFAEKFYYYEGISKNVFLDITDVVTEQNSDGKTILSKFNPEQQSFYSYNDKYYAIPHYSYYGGLVYNIDVFEDNLLYFSNNSAINGGFITSLTATRSLGPDGKTGVIDGVDYTVDDGLPATYEEFFKLCDRMVDCDVIPFTWSGQYGKAYFTSVLSRLLMGFEGREQTMLNMTFDGVATNLVDTITEDGEVIYKEPTVITPENGYEIFTSAGRYWALKFGEQLFSKRDYYDFEKVASDTDSHTDAQTRFILSNYDPAQKPIAMLVEGTYWDNEAADVGAFNALESIYKVSRQDTRFGFMPMPKVDETHIGEKDVLSDNAFTLAFINANVAERCPEKIELLKEFMKFAHTDESLREYTVKTNSFKALNYEIEESDKTQLTYFTKSLADLLERSDIVYQVSTTQKFIDNQSKLKLGNGFTVNNYQFPMNGLKDGVTAADYFKQIKSYYNATYWATM